VNLIGVSQNDAADTTAFAEEFGVTFPILLDDTRSYPVSNAYGLTNVPTLFWIGTDGKVEITSMGWSKPDFEKINRRMAEAAAIATAPMFRPEDDLRDYRAG
jgi:peroxiredoxin